jgi:hypothetical protein
MELPNTKLWETGIIIQPLKSYELKNHSFFFLVGPVCLVKHEVKLKLSIRSTFSFFLSVRVIYDSYYIQKKVSI